MYVGVGPFTHSLCVAVTAGTIAAMSSALQTVTPSESFSRNV